MSKVESLDIVTPQELAWLQNDMAQRIGPEGVDNSMYPGEIAERFPQSEYPDIGTVLDRRVIFRGNEPAYQLVEKIVRRRLPARASLYIAYQRQMIPHHPHIDPIDSEPDPETAFSMVIPLMEAEEFKLLVWKKEFRVCKDIEHHKNYFRVNVGAPNDHFKNMISDFKFVDDISNRYQLSHCYNGSPMYTDYIELEGVYQYKLGTMGLFPRLQMHASNNWLECGKYTHKDLVIVHAT